MYLDQNIPHAQKSNTMHLYSCTYNIQEKRENGTGKNDQDNNTHWPKVREVVVELMLI